MGSGVEETALIAKANAKRSLCAASYGWGVKPHLEMTFLLVRNQAWADTFQLVLLPWFSVLGITAGQDINIEGCSLVFLTVHVSKCLKN